MDRRQALPLRRVLRGRGELIKRGRGQRGHERKNRLQLAKVKGNGALALAAAEAATDFPVRYFMDQAMMRGSECVKVRRNNIKQSRVSILKITTCGVGHEI